MPYKQYVNPISYDPEEVNVAEARGFTRSGGGSGRDTLLGIRLLKLELAGNWCTKAHLFLLDSRSITERRVSHYGVYLLHGVYCLFLIFDCEMSTCHGRPSTHGEIKSYPAKI